MTRQPEYVPLPTDTAIRVRGLSKHYQIYKYPGHRLRQFIFPRLDRLVGRPPRCYFEEFRALHDVSFDVRRGETVGVIGRNGSGKSTLLQLVCGTLTPTSGEVELSGRVAALLELGSGFNPEFTGRENVFMNGAVLGLSTREIEDRFEAIAAFADIGDFIEQPVKTYSSGMVVRLAFAVSVNVDPEILVVDEALSVGDSAFQFKCMKRMETLRDRGVTVLLVSHDMATVQNICTRAVYLEKGRVKAEGNPEAVAAQYFFDNRELHRQALGISRPIKQQQPIGPPPRAAAFGTGEGQISAALFADSQTSQTQVRLGEPLEILIDLHCPPNEEKLALAVVVQTHRLVEITGRRFALEPSEHARRRMRIILENPFCRGDFFITLRLVRRVGENDYSPLQSQIAALHFRVVDQQEQDFMGLCRTDIRLEEREAGPFRVIALLGVRNEAVYMERCLRHLYEQGVQTVIIDNDSTDETTNIARQWLGRGVIGIERFPYPGFYDWRGILEFKAELAASLDADWFIHHDADEVRQSRRPDETLVQALKRLDKAGYTAVDFDEFVFLPLDKTGQPLETPPKETDYVTGFPLAYYFAPGPRHRINAWKKIDERVDLASHGGHRVAFPGLRLAPEKLILRHYPCLGVRHLVEKYGKQRIYSTEEVRELGWHGRRAVFDPEGVWWPSPNELQRPEVDGWKTDRVRIEHPFLGGRSEVLQPMPFIVGVGRSGTTLLRLMLDAHPDVAIPPETHFLAAMLQDPPASAEKFMTMLTDAPTWGDFQLDAEKLRLDVTGLEPFDLARAARLFYKHYAARFNKPRCGDKSPPYVKYISALADVFPEARFIHMIRDGRDVALSYKDKWFGPGRNLADAAVFWREHILQARLQARELTEGRYLELRFEDLIGSPEIFLKQICDFLDLTYSPAMLDYHHHAARRLDEMGDRPDERGNVQVPREQRLSIHKHVRRPPDPTQAGKWKQAMSTEEISSFQDIAGDLLTELGYDD
ncbi:ABC-type polysaccharide/polyol phosphate transport system, ATPase component [Desulfonatronum zhilinae]|nr:ABC-type polysaccharide/polyol phosphate transport system, ATPase component [Desulfonatronum zhilinae]